jgi:curved DNA-binding protein CbpA
VGDLRIDGEHFLTDYYALLGLKRFESDPELIRQAYMTFKSRQPARTRQRPQSEPTKSELLWRLGVRAYDTLSSNIKKKEYDARLANWEGPISADGIPVVRITDPMWRKPIIPKEAPTQTSDESQRFSARLQSHDDPQLLDHLRSGRQLSGQAALLYFMAAERHLEYWRERINLRRQAEGLPAHVFSEGPIKPQLIALHKKEASQAETDWQRLEADIRAGTVKTLPAGDITLEEQWAQATQARTETTAAVLSFAEQYDAMLEELASPLYAPRQDTLHPNVIVVLHIGDGSIRFAYRWDGDEPQIANELSDEKLEELDAPEESLQLIADGWNIVYAFYPYGSTPMARVEAVVRDHYARLWAGAHEE